MSRGLLADRPSTRPRYDAYTDSGVDWLGEVPRDLLQYVDLESYRTVETHSGGADVTSGSDPLPPQKEAGDGRASPVEEEPLSEILRLLNQRFGYDFSEGDREFLERLEANVCDHEAVRTSIRVNGPREARLTFNEVAEDELQDLIDANFTLYKKIVDNDAFARILFDHLFEQCVETVENND
jgi:type I restriction enzyme R subunit